MASKDTSPPTAPFALWQCYVCVCVRTCVRVCVSACVRACMRACVCDAHIFQSKLRLRGSTFLRILQDISKTMSPEFFRPRWQALRQCCVCAKHSIPIMLKLRGSTVLYCYRICKPSILSSTPCRWAVHKGIHANVRTLHRRHTTAPALLPHLRCTKTHIACACALPLPTAHPTHP